MAKPKILPVIALWLVALVMVFNSIQHVAIAFAKEQTPKPTIPNPTDNQYVVMVFDSHCIEVLEKTENSQVWVAVDDNGDPIMSQTHLTHIHLELTSKQCGYYQVRYK